ncbi:unnamed protein product [Anisakis simplex]|uniref:DRBM domain-containing protein n=1 Tax=Anisakis simplex TaxID=6269 RepID=A0A0M3K530_ANISI|nr:unnamed protein product [Anisakis simplex]
MSSDLFEVFTDVEVLKSREPEYFQCQEVVNIGNESDMYPSSLPAAVPPQPNGSASGCQESATSRMQIPPTIAGKTFVGVLEEGCRKYYDGTTPTYSGGFQLDWFAIKCELRKLSGVGSAKTKKSAKQLAAKEVLLKIIMKMILAIFIADTFLFIDWFTLSVSLFESSIPAGVVTRNKLMPELSAPEEETDSNLSENWIGKINEKYVIEKASCQKLKLRGAVYDVKDEGVAPQHLFVATCSVCKLTTTGQGRTKKEDMQEDEFVGELAVMKLVREAQMDCKDAESKLQDLLNADDELVKEVFTKQQLNFTIFSEADVNGDIQCMLKVLGANDESNVFGGNGQNEQLSRDCAAREAFEFLYVFMKSNLEKRQLEEKKKQDGQEK